MIKKLDICYRMILNLQSTTYFHITILNRTAWFDIYKIISLILYYTPVFRRVVLWYGDVCPSVRPSVRVSIRVSVRQSQFSALFSFMLWRIELKFGMSLSCYKHSIKFECRQFPSSFVGVMPLLELKYCKYSFPHFSPTCFDILRWNFAYDFILLYYRSSLSVVNFRQFL